MENALDWFLTMTAMGGFWAAFCVLAGTALVIFDLIEREDVV